ncbi:hypothetical protein OUZ56_013854 [Daphnia magna]|uniref:Uncharacterized protein n=1 Tax=Daphnia magna TaxID=35525 RepID=A0ABQ9Z745_9CRUS|nr:hypothetical protein OUZ56_013854 [Daphnia magna]
MDFLKITLTSVGAENIIQRTLSPLPLIVYNMMETLKKGSARNRNNHVATGSLWFYLKVVFLLKDLREKLGTINREPRPKKAKTWRNGHKNGALCFSCLFPLA